MSTISKNTSIEKELLLLEEISYIYLKRASAGDEKAVKILLHISEQKRKLFEMHSHPKDVTLKNKKYDSKKLRTRYEKITRN